MMKPTQLLIIDHDVCRYHTLDLFRWILYQDVQAKDYKHFGSVNPVIRRYLVGDQLKDQLLIFKMHCESPNPHVMFKGDPARDLPLNKIEDELNVMMSNPMSQATLTDVGIRLDPIFELPQLTGTIIRYKADTTKPVFLSRMTVYEEEHILDVDLLCYIIEKHRINAIMLSIAELAVLLTDALQKRGYTEHITFIVGHYGYNYTFQDGKPYYLRYNEVFGELELRYKHEYGSFEPYTGLVLEQRGITQEASHESTDPV